MTEHRSLVRKVIYLLLILLLILPLSYIGLPASSSGRPGQHRQGSSGGVLAQLRYKHHLGEANLGEINPTSETFKLATLGMRPFAVPFLWWNADHYKKVEDWKSLTATLELITLLQPHFVAVWHHQAHNLALNVAADFDDHRVRYFYAKKGISFLMKGTIYNQREPGMLWDVGWNLNQKIGRSDEHVQFRRMFAVDEDFHDLMKTEHNISFASVDGPDGNPDNWLVGREWFLKAEERVESDVRIGVGKKGPLLFYQQSAKCKINYAEVIEKDGHFGKHGRIALDAWKKAEAAWRKFGTRQMPGRTGSQRLHRLGEYQDRPIRLAKIRAQLDALEPGLRDKLRDEKLATLSEDFRMAYQMDPKQRNPQQQDLAQQAGNALAGITNKIVAENVSEKNREQALILAAAATAEALIISDILRSLQIVPYHTWLDSCIVEQSANVIEGRRRLNLAKQQYRKALLDSAASKSDDEKDLGARQQFELAFAAWKRAFEEYPRLYKDRPICEDLVTVITIYQRKVLDSDKLPDDFALMKVVELYPADGIRRPPKPTKKEDQKEEDKKEDGKKAKSDDNLKSKDSPKPASDK